MPIAGGQILVISRLEEDRKLGKVLALNNSVQYLEATDNFEIQRILEKNPNSVVLFDYDELKNNQHVLDILSKYCRPKLSLAITKDGLASYPELIKFAFFGNNIQRRYADPAPAFYSKLVGSALSSSLEGIKPYFAHDTKIHRIELKNSGHKSKAIEALQKTLTNRGIQGRLATLVAQGVDELILNAIFDAPFSRADNLRYRHKELRDKEFEMNDQETVVVEMAVSDQYMGICVIDQFGSLDTQSVFKALRPYLSKEPIKSDPLLGLSSGFGISGIVQSGLNLKIACQPGQRTESLIFFPIVGSFKEFRSTFRYLSVVSDSAKA